MNGTTETPVPATVLVANPESDAAAIKSRALSSSLSVVLVIDDASLEAAAAIVTQASDAYKEAERVYRTMKDPVNTSAKAIDGFWRPILDAFDKIKRGQTAKIVSYREEQRKKAEREAEAERVRLQAEKDEAERKRKAAEDEAKRAADELAKASESGNLADELAAEDLRLQAIETEKKLAEDLERATAKAETPVEAVAPPKKIETAGASLGFRTVWKFEVTNAALVPREFLEVNESAIRKAIAVGKRSIPGVYIYETEAARVG